MNQSNKVKDNKDRPTPRVKTSYGYYYNDDLVALEQVRKENEAIKDPCCKWCWKPLTIEEIENNEIFLECFACLLHREV